MSVVVDGRVIEVYRFKSFKDVEFVVGLFEKYLIVKLKVGNGVKR